MKVSWKTFFRRLASMFLAIGATAWSSAMCYAQIASDVATNAAYADGWQAGDNGGAGFAPWNFDGSYDPPPNSIHLVNSSHPENDLGTAWAMSLSFDYGLARAGRGFAAPLQVGQTFSIIVDVPTEHRFFRGYTIRLNSGGGNICYGGLGCTPGTDPVERFAIWSYHDQPDPDQWGQWRVTPSVSPFFIPIDDEDTDAGMRMDFTLTGPEAYELTMTPLDEPGMAYTRSGALFNPGAGAIDWIEFLHYDEPTDPLLATDLYISSMQITGGATATGDFDADGDVDGADFLRWQRGLGTASGATQGQGDADADGDVDSADLAIWKNQYGADAIAVSSGIPEPGCIGLAVAGMIGVLWLEFRRPQPGK